MLQLFVCDSVWWSSFIMLDLVVFVTLYHYTNWGWNSSNIGKYDLLSFSFSQVDKVHNSYVIYIGIYKIIYPFFRSVKKRKKSEEWTSKIPWKEIRSNFQQLKSIVGLHKVVIFQLSHLPSRFRVKFASIETAQKLYCISYRLCPTI